MAEKDKIAEEKVVHDGLFDMKDVYNFLYTFFVDNEYRIEERVYKEKNIGGAKEIEINWLIKRKINDYFRFQIKADWRILKMTTVEVMKEGKKVVMNKGNLEIKFQAYLERDYENKWESSAFYKFLRSVYDEFIIKKTIKGYEEKIDGELNEVVNQLKSFLVLEGKR